MVFYKRSQDTRRGDAGIVQRMGKFDFAVFVVAVSQIGATSLPLGDVGAGVGFAVAVLRRCPRFQIILAVFGGRFPIPDKAIPNPAILLQK